MRNIFRICMLAMGLFAWSSCTRLNSDYCPDPDPFVCPAPCEVNTDCTNAAAPVCVESTCARCTAHAQCASDVCIGDGTCAEAASVAFVDSTGTNNLVCTQETPCTRVSSALATRRPYVKLTGTFDEGITVEDGQVVTILAEPGTRLLHDPSSGPDDPVVTVKGDNTSLTISDLDILVTSVTGTRDAIVIPPSSGAPKLSLIRATMTSTVGQAIRASGGIVTVTESRLPAGISMESGSLTVTKSTIGSASPAISTRNTMLILTESTLAENVTGIVADGGTLDIRRNVIAENRLGGLLITGDTKFLISENFIVHNGQAVGSPSQVGGAVITSNTAGSFFMHNTLAFNQSDGMMHRGGLSCTGGLVDARDNLLFHNEEPDGAGGTTSTSSTQYTQLNDTCRYTNMLAIPRDTANLGFRSPLAQPYDFHLTSATPRNVLDQPGSCAGTDFDGDARPMILCDLGADEQTP